MYKYACTNCELPMAQPHCVCGGIGIRHLDARPVLLDPRVRRLVDQLLDRLVLEATSSADGDRVRLIREGLLPRYFAVVAEHQRALRCKEAGSPVQTLHGSVDEQLEVLASSARPKRGDPEELRRRAERCCPRASGQVIFLPGRTRAWPS